MAELTMEQLEAKFDKFQREMPALTKNALKKGTTVLRDEMRLRYTASGLKRRTSKLYNAIKVLNVERAGKNVKAAVGVTLKQTYKAVAHELGMTVGHGVTLPKRAFVGPTKQAKLNQVEQMILDELIQGYEKLHV